MADTPALDAAVTRLRELTRTHADQLVLIEDLAPDTRPAEIAKKLGLSDRIKPFTKFHSENWGRWRKPSQPGAAKTTETLPHDYGAFLKGYGSLTLLSVSGVDGGRWVDNLSEHGWGLITVLNDRKRAWLTSYFREYDVDGEELHEYGLDRIIAFAGFVNDGWAFDTRRTNAAGDFGIVRLDEDEIFANTLPESRLADAKPPKQSFTQWLEEQVEQVEKQLAKLITKAKAKAKAKTTASDSPALLERFVAAVDGGEDEAALAILRDNPALVNATNERGSTPLMLAAGRNRIAVLEHLSSIGAGVNDAREDGMTALLFAASRGHREAVEWLLDRDADLEHKEKNGATALLAACNDQGCALPVLELLVARGADIDAKDKYGLSLVVRALRAKRPDVACWAVAHGFTPTVGALGSAAYFDAKELAEMLLDRGAATAQPDATYPPLHGSVVRTMKNRPTDLLELLIARKVDLDGRNDDGWTALHMAVYQTNARGIKLLVAAGADVNAKDKKGEAPLHVAAREAHAELVTLLCKLGADVDAVNTKGKRPLDVVPKAGTTNPDDIKSVREALKAAAKPPATKAPPKRRS